MQTAFLIRQRYVEDDEFLLQLQCESSKPWEDNRRYSTGRIMKPVVLLEKVSQGSTGLLRAGLLQRLVEVVDEDIHMESNELVYTGGRLFQEGDTHT